MEEAFEIIATNFGWTNFLEGCFYKLRLEIFLKPNLKLSPRADSVGWNQEE